MAKEGFDWSWCEHALTVGYRSSLTEIVQIIGRATRDAPGKTRTRFTNLIAEPDAAEEAVAEAVNDTLKAIAASLLMEQVLAPRFEFKPKNPTSGPVEGFDYGEGGYNPQKCNVGFNEGTGKFQIEIKGLVTPKSEEGQRVFEQVQNALNSGLRQTRRFERKSEIDRGRFYILGGQKAYVAAMEEPYKNEHGYVEARLRVIFDNGTESNLLMRSLQKALQQDPAGRRIVEPTAGPLFGDDSEEGDEASGIVYVLRSKSDDPYVAEHRNVLHKIGVTGGDVARRLANARLDPTFLMAEVEVVATYELFNSNRTRLENLIHRVFGPARLGVEIKDRFGQPIIPREWFLVPLFIIDEVIERIRDGTIPGYRYDPQSATLLRA